jgi:hypothetical protein
MTNDNDQTAELYLRLTRQIKQQQERDEDDIERSQSRYPRTRCWE